jgi:hypothetical protein
MIKKGSFDYLKKQIELKIKKFFPLMGNLVISLENF